MFKTQARKKAWVIAECIFFPVVTFKGFRGGEEWLKIRVMLNLTLCKVF